MGTEQVLQHWNVLMLVREKVCEEKNPDCTWAVTARSSWNKGWEEQPWGQHNIGDSSEFGGILQVIFVALKI